MISIIQPNMDANFFVTVVSFLRGIYDLLAKFFTDVEELVLLIQEFTPVVTFIQLVSWTPISICIMIVSLVAVIKVCLGWGNT